MWRGGELKPSSHRGAFTAAGTSLLSSSVSGRAPTSGESEPAFGSEAGVGRTTCSVCSQLPRGKGWKSSQRNKSLTLPRNNPPPPHRPRFPTERSPSLFIRLGGTYKAPPPRSETKPTKRRSKTSLNPLRSVPNATSRVKSGCTSHVDN